VVRKAYHGLLDRSLRSLVGAVCGLLGSVVANLVVLAWAAPYEAKAGLRFESVKSSDVLWLAHAMYESIIDHVTDRSPSHVVALRHARKRLVDNGS
jgi:hypothetical protein